MKDCMDILQITLLLIVLSVYNFPLPSGFAVHHN